MTKPIRQEFLPLATLKMVTFDWVVFQWFKLELVQLRVVPPYVLVRGLARLVESGDESKQL